MKRRYIVKNKFTGNTWGEFKTMEEALKYCRKLMRTHEDEYYWVETEIR